MRKKKKKYSFRRKHKRVKKTTKTVTFNGIQLKLLRYKNMWVFPEIRTYMYGAGSPIEMSLLIYQNENLNDYGTVTVNLPDCQRSAGCQFIDINNNMPYLLKWLIKNKFGELTGRYGKCGYCTYPEFNFYAGKTFRDYKTINDRIDEEYEKYDEE